MIRDFFYIGGDYVYEPAYNSSIYSDQMYVEKLTPLSRGTEHHPIVFISAGIPSGVVRLCQLLVASITSSNTDL